MKRRLVLALALSACSVPPPPEAPPPSASSPASASVAPRTDPAVELARAEATRRCYVANCAQLGKGCFDNCRRHAHPRDPEAHAQCDDSCRSSYGVDACEAKCKADAEEPR